MTKPAEYGEQRIIRNDTTYQVNEQHGKGPQAGSGVLTTGRVVWIENARDLQQNQPTIQAFAEGIGVVSVNTRSLS